jgi:hypothetical protein
MNGLYLKSLTCWLLVLMIGLTTQTQANQAIPYPVFPSMVVSTQIPGLIEVGSRMGVLTDASRSLTFDQATTQLTGWQAINRVSPNFGFTRDAYWFSFQIENTTEQELPRLIELPIPFIDELNFYHLVGNKLKKSYVLSDEKPFSQRIVRHQNFIMPVKLVLGSNLIYTRLASVGTIEAPFRIWDPERFHEANRDENLIQGLLIGILLIMVVHNLFVFLSTG